MQSSFCSRPWRVSPGPFLVSTDRQFSIRGRALIKLRRWRQTQSGRQCGAYILAESVWREAIARWPRETIVLRPRRASGRGQPAPAGGV